MNYICYKLWCKKKATYFKTKSDGINIFHCSSHAKEFGLDKYKEIRFKGDLTK